MYPHSAAWPAPRLEPQPALLGRNQPYVGPLPDLLDRNKPCWAATSLAEPQPALLGRNQPSKRIKQQQAIPVPTALGGGRPDKALPNGPRPE